MRTRILLSCLAAVLTLLVAAPAEAGPTRTPAERAREIATALAKDPLYIDPAYKTALPANLQEDVSKKAGALGYPVYTMVLPLTPSDEFQGQEQNVLTLVMDALKRPGLYVVVDGGSRFPWYEAKNVPQVNEEKLDASRTRALEDTGYDAGPTEVLARMYELLAQPGIPKTSKRPSGSVSPVLDPEGRGWGVALSIVGGLVVLVGLGLVIGRRRGAGRGKTFRIPPHVAATVAAERRRRLTRETNAELTTLGSQLAALPATAGAGLVHQHQQAALDGHAAASKVLDSSPGLVDLVGAMVLLDKARREYAAAVAIAADRKVEVVPDLCAFNPLHGRSSGRPTKVESDGTTLTLPLCDECRQALKRKSAPASLPGEDGPYWYEDSVWARTFFGTTGDDLAAAVARGELSR
ncbi:hypothetical protein [Kribbella sindirgiensis]|uniref:TPM domain-containing protein n=1 Tax=Kribbella sindirgiensis TaxID=1124744 RepID=A0A4R0JCM6_9ACTN|nr:hypothetical protein [Kribbella sindirgiensis]TCC43214.1 hypothetical protein E0H50_01640 [Kribbella sindirgiensis]